MRGEAILIFIIIIFRLKMIYIQKSRPQDNEMGWVATDILSFK